MYLSPLILILLLPGCMGRRVPFREHPHSTRQGSTLPLTYSPPDGSFDSDRSAHQSSWTSGSRRKEKHQHKGSNSQREKRPNIILIMTDDQDIELGSMSFMPKTRRILGEGGAHFPNAYVTTPMCCPSRSSMLTGLYVHNHNVYTNNDNCSSPQWQQEFESKSFATYLSNAGYRTAYFGKYLNEYSGNHIPPGWREWAALIRNSRFYNYTINVNGNKIKHGVDYNLDYYPDLVANDSIAFFRRSKEYFNKPVLMVMAFPSPHGPEDAAPQYQHKFFNITTHRTPSWNYAPNHDKQWLLQYTGKMEPIHMRFTDMLHTKRLQTLQSVDDAVERLYKELIDLGELNNTYIFYSSDHGYHLGQFGLVKGKSMPFEFDVRVPFFVRGPKVPPTVRIRDIVLNIDLAPTFLDIAGIDIPDHMDGKSIFPILTDAHEYVNNGNDNTEIPRKKTWRDTFLIERGKVTKEFTEASPRLTKEQALALKCRNPKYTSPCRPHQKWECVRDGFKWRFRKCKPRLLHPQPNYYPKPCVCPSDNEDYETGPVLEARQRPMSHISLPRRDDRKKARLTAEERKLQRQFLKEHVLKDFRPVFLRARSKRDSLALLNDTDLEELISLYPEFFRDISEENENVTESMEATREPAVTAHNLAVRSLPPHLSPKSPQGLSRGCEIFANQSISCFEEVYRNPRLWKEKKERLDTQIKKLRQKLDELKGIRRHLKKKRPLPGFGSVDSENDDFKEECDCSSENAYSKRVDALSLSADLDNPLDEFREHKDSKVKKKERKLRRRTKFENTTCNLEKMNCFTHDNNHWKTPPYWTYGPFCFCQNSNNNTFWCVRTINETHNFLYCEFITGFRAYFDLTKDPYQLINRYLELEPYKINELQNLLLKLRGCKTARDCTVRYRSESTRRAYSGTSSMSKSRSQRHKHRRHSKGRHLQR